MKSIELQGLIGKPFLSESGAVIGTITSALADKDGIRIKSTVHDPELRQSIAKQLHAGEKIGGSL